MDNLIPAYDVIKPFVSVEWYGLACANRCLHCYLHAGQRASVSVSYDRAKAIAERFLAWAQATQDQRIRVGFCIGCSYETQLPMLIDYVSFRRDNRMDGWDYLPMNGLRLRTQEELLHVLGSLQSAGLRMANLTFYGARGSHDVFARRGGDFDYLLLIAQVIAELGLARSETILLRKSTLPELPELLRMLDAIPGLEQRAPSMCDYLGRAADLEEERLELQDLKSLPAALRDSINPDRYRTEVSWIQSIMAGDVPAKTRLLYVVAVRDDNVDYLEREDCEFILRHLWQREQERRASAPSLINLAREYGDPVSQRLFAFRDLERKWLGTYYRRHKPDFLREWLDPSAPRIRLE